MDRDVDNANFSEKRPNFAAIAPFLQSNEMEAMLPRRLALWAAAGAPLAFLDPSHTSTTIEIQMLWGDGADQDQSLQWLLNGLRESVGYFYEARSA